MSTEEKVRHSLLIEKSLSDKIRDYRFEGRFETVSGAIVSLIERGLRDYEEQKKKKKI